MPARQRWLPAAPDTLLSRLQQFSFAICRFHLRALAPCASLFWYLPCDLLSPLLASCSHNVVGPAAPQLQQW